MAKLEHFCLLYDRMKNQTSNWKRKKKGYISQRLRKWVLIETEKEVIGILEREKSVQKWRNIFESQIEK